MRSDDRVLFAQTLSKNWAMTGWRIGWLEAPPELGPAIESLVQYSTSGVPVASQRAAMAAIAQGEDLVDAQVRRAFVNRDLLAEALRSTGRLRCAVPDGAFYLFCGIAGVADSRSLALRLVDEAGVGVAPGSAFGAAGRRLRAPVLRAADRGHRRGGAAAGGLARARTAVNAALPPAADGAGPASAYSAAMAA